MPVLTFPKSALGAVVDVSLLPSSRLRQVFPTWPLRQQPANIKMLIDSGAEHTSVDSHQIDPAWGLHPVSFYLSQSMGGVNSIPLFDLELSILDVQNGTGPFWRHDPLLVASRDNDPFSGLPYQGVIGRDILDRGLFTYNGVVSHCTLAF